MEIKGRECKEIKIGKYTYWFISEFKTKEFRSILKSSFVKQLNITDGEKNKAIEIDLNDLYEDMIPYAKEFCMLLKDEAGEELEITDEFIDNLEISDFNELINITSDLVVKVAGGEKKVSKQSTE